MITSQLFRSPFWKGVVVSWLMGSSGGIGWALSAPSVHQPMSSEQLAARALASGQSPHVMGQQGRELWDWALESNNCDSLKMAAFLILESSNQIGNSPATESALAIESEFSCPVTSGALAYSLGANAALNGDWVRAAFWFDRSAGLAKNEPAFFLKNVLNALSVAQMSTGRHLRAIQTLEELYNLGPEGFPLEGYNSIAYANYLVANCEGALEWCRLGNKRIAETLADESISVVDVRRAATGIQLTELEVCIAMGDAVRAAQVFNALDFNSNFDQRELAAAGLLTVYFQSTGQLELASMFRPRLQQWADKSSIDVLEDGLGVNSRLYSSEGKALSEEMWRERLMSLAETPLVMRGLPGAGCASVSEASQMDRLSQAELTWRVAGLISFLSTLIAMTVYLILRRRRREMEELQSEGEQEIIARLDRLAKQWASSLSRRRYAAQAFALLVKRHFPEERTGLEEIVQDWPQLERDVVNLLSSGLKTNEVAIQLGLSMTRVYAVRRAVRKRLKLPSHVVLEAWLEARKRS